MTAGVDLEDERIVIGAQKIFDGIENRMSLIHRTSDQAIGREHVYGYEGTSRVNPKLLETLKIAASDWRLWMGECGTRWPRPGTRFSRISPPMCRPAENSPSTLLEMIYHGKHR